MCHFRWRRHCSSVHHCKKIRQPSTARWSFLSCGWLFPSETCRTATTQDWWYVQFGAHIESWHISNYFSCSWRYETWQRCTFFLPIQNYISPANWSEGHFFQSWALSVFFNFFYNKKWVFAFFIKLIWLGVGFLNRTGGEIGC